MKPTDVLHSRGLAVGFDIGGSTIRSGLVEIAGERWAVRAERRELLDPAGKAPEALVGSIARHVRELAAEAGLDAADVPVGVGLCAQLTRDGRRVVNAPNLGWRGVDILDRLEAALPGLPLRLDNDLNAILLGENAFGAARGYRDVVAVYPGTGIGGAVMLDGRLWRGAHGFAGEIGHVGWGGQTTCGCGQVGCSETLAGGFYVEQRVAAEQALGLLPASLGDSGVRLRVDDLDRAFAGGDAYAAALWREVVAVLSGLAATAVTLLDPELLLLGGGVVEHCPGLTAEIAAGTRRRCPAAIAAELHIATGSLGPLAGVLGAAALALG